MREIKFRGKDVLTGKWAYGDLVHNKKITETDLVDRTMVGGYEVDPDTVGQFTGLYDRNGKEIFEGDIVRTSVAKDDIALVEWHSGHAAFVVHMKGSSQWYPLDKRDKIIGNVHDNPSLLEGGLKCFTL